MTTTDVVMPQMGESIAEGTIVRWIKQVGDAVERDEPLFEISTDKVDAEIPSPAAGVLTEIRAQEGATVPVNSVVAIIGPAGAPAAAPPPGQAQAAGKAAAPAQPSAAPARSAGETAPAARPGPSAPSGQGPAAPDSGAAQATGAPASAEETARQRSSPLVRKIAKEHGIDITQISGTGIGGRVTKDDILAFIDRGPTGRDSTQAPAGARATEAPTRDVRRPPQPAPGAPTPGTTVPMTVMRKKIAEHMILSKRTSAHVHSVFEVNFTRVARLREAMKEEYERAGAKLTYLSFIMKAAVDALRAVPVVNASVEGDSIAYHQDVNLGIAVALDWGLIVPVIRRADEKNLLGLTRAVADLASRARSKQLKPDDVTGGTFTITNPGSFGTLFGMPIINQPQVAILGVGIIEKRPVVIDDAIAIRPMGYLTLGYDHRVIDGAVADQFMSHLKRQIENWEDEM
ncbi:MAG: 2-oxoglutarate dehydrogenase, E2 component, dihydrolipoamide succinyltransferase [Vicinamibacterales bacterium]